MGEPYLYVYASIVAVVILYVNTVFLLKNIKKDKDTLINTIIGSFCGIVILVSIFEICGVNR